MRTYKVVSVSEPKFFSVLEPKDLENILNREAAEGWIYQGDFTGASPMVSISVQKIFSC
jgi:hypothetical protein